MNCIKYLSLLFIGISGAYGQYLSFDHPPYTSLITDSLGIWQVGKPQKTVLNTTVSYPNVIITDTINPYGVNIVASFTLEQNIGVVNLATLEGYYNVNSDSLNDYGVIELSIDDGNSWIDLMNDTVYTSWIYWWDKPVLTGNSNGWKEFSVSFGDLLWDLGIQNRNLLFRFTFISDSIPDSLDGLMYDNFHFGASFFGIDETFGKVASTAYPNPATSSLTIEFDNPDLSPFQLIIYDKSGREIFTKNNVTTVTEIETQSMSSGLYFYRLMNLKNRKMAGGKFLVER